jgi:hypothetical protein
MKEERIKTLRGILLHGRRTIRSVALCNHGTHKREATLLRSMNIKRSSREK